MEYLAVFGGVAHLVDFEYAVPLHYLGSAQHVVAFISGLGVEIVGVDGLVAGGFAGEGGLVHSECHRFEQLPVGGNLVAGVEYHDVADNDVAFGYFYRVAVAYHAYGLLVVDLVEYGELTVGFRLEYECEPGGKYDGHEYARRLEKHGGAFVKTEILIERYAYRQCSRNEEDDNQRVAKLLQKATEKRFFLCRSKDVDAMLLTAFDNFCLGQSDKVRFFLHS